MPQHESTVAQARCTLGVEVFDQMVQITLLNAVRPAALRNGPLGRAAGTTGMGRAVVFPLRPTL
jgi:hypothetical protein